MIIIGCKGHGWRCCGPVDNNFNLPNRGAFISAVRRVGCEEFSVLWSGSFTWISNNSVSTEITSDIGVNDAHTCSRPLLFFLLSSITRLTQFSQGWNGKLAKSQLYFSASTIPRRPF